MAKPFLRSGSLDDVLTLSENGRPVYAVALQLREALRMQQQQAAADCLAIPMPSEQGERIDWYAPITGRVTAWNSADAAAKTVALHQLEQFHSTANAISLRARNSAKVSQQLFAALLSKALQFPDQNAVFLVNGKPVITFWGVVKPDGKTRTDPLDCLRPEEDSPAESIVSPVIEIAVAPTEIPVTPPPITPSVVDKRLRRIWGCLSALAMLASLGGWFAFYQPKAESPPPAVKVAAQIKTVAKPSRSLVGLHLPLCHAEVLSSPVVTPVVVDKLALTLPAESVKIGSTAFLNGKWRATLAVKDPLTGKLPSLLYQFKNGKGTARITQGDKVTCRVEVSAGLMQSGNLVINSRTKARCNDGSRYQIPELVCRQGDAGAADYTGRYGTETVFPMTIKRESK